jgi:hypothetical protein
MLRDHYFFFRFVQHITAGAANLIEQNQTAALATRERQHVPSGTGALFSYHLLIPLPPNPASQQ